MITLKPKINWIKTKLKPVEKKKEKKLDKDYSCTSKFIIYDGIHDYGYLEK
jgi:hypothetical protein